MLAKQMEAEQVAKERRHVKNMEKKARQQQRREAAQATAAHEETNVSYYDHAAALAKKTAALAVENVLDASSTAPKTRASADAKRKWKESWMTERGGVEHERQLWLYYEAATGTMNCKACILFGAKRGNIMVVGCSRMRLGAIKEHHAFGGTNGHAAALRLLKEAKQLND